MLDDHEFFIRKAIGWVLRDTARKRPDLVFDWLLPRAARASSLTIREAIKPMSERQHRRFSPPGLSWLGAFESVVEEGGDASLPLVGMSVEGAGVSGVRNDPHVDGFG